VATAAATDIRQDIAGKLLTPLRYGRVDQSGLHFTVHHGRNKIDLPLISK
jgi:hypothetical protein